MKRPQVTASILTALLAAPLCASAENSTSADGYTIHHNAFGSDTLTPEVAKSYGIQRSKYRGLLNVSVVKDVPGSTGTPVPATVDAKIVTLTGQSSRLPMREIQEGEEAYYYIGEFPVHNAQTVDFAIEVTPQGSDNTFTMRMDQQFFTE